MSVDVRVECTIERAPAVVASFAGDPARATTKELARLKSILETT